MAETQRKRSFWTWGFTADEPSLADRRAAAKRIARRTGVEVAPPPVPDLADIDVRAPRLKVPAALQGWVSTDSEERLLHTYGGHVTELLAALRGRFENPPDAVAHPANEEELERTLAWADQQGHVVVPYGGGTSVVWGVNAPEQAETVVTVDLDRLNGVLEIDPVSRAARLQAGLLGPDLEDALRPHGLTLRHFPRAFPGQPSAVGWPPVRGHYATNHTHIDDFVQSARLLTPKGWWESRRLPGSGAGPSPDRMVIGSEGVLGIISECWLRLQKRPTFRATAGIAFDSWAEGAEAVRQIVQAKLWPANLRLLDPVEARQSAGVEGRLGAADRRL